MSVCKCVTSKPFLTLKCLLQIEIFCNYLASSVTATLTYGQLFAGSKHRFKCFKNTCNKAVAKQGGLSWAWMLTAEELYCLTLPELPTWWAANRTSAPETQVAQARSHQGVLCALVRPAWQGSGINMVNALFLSVFFPLSKSAPGRKRCTSFIQIKVYPSTASRNHPPPEWLPHQLKRWLNTSFCWMKFPTTSLFWA